MDRVFFAMIAVFTLGSTSCELTDALNRQVDEPCASIFECDDAKGLVCGGGPEATGTCQEPGSATTGELGDACDKKEHCRIEYACHPAGACAPTGVLAEGAGCDLINYCAPGADLACSFPVGGEIAGICKQAGQDAQFGNKRCEKAEECTAGGTHLVGGDCLDTFDCALGLLCAPGLGGKKCSQLPFYRGRSCPVSNADEGPLRALFEIIEGGTPAEFYRQPFPADWRKNGGGFVDLAGHPHPSFQLANKIADRAADMSRFYLTHISENVKAFSTTAAAYLRVSGRMDRASFKGEGDEGQNIFFVDVSQGPFRGEPVPLEFDYRQSRGKYICGNRLAVRSIDTYPLRPATTYAIYVMDTVKGRSGESVGRDADFRRMLGTDKPGGGAAATAYEAMKPLRDWLKDQDIDPDKVLTGTVFTTDDVHAISRGMAKTIEAQDTPEVPDKALCVEAEATFCASDGTDDAEAALLRSCPAQVNDKFHEIHLRVSLPMFQVGTPPFLTNGSGGNIELNDDGTAKVQGRDPVCAALTIPKGVDMPDGGWPVVLYGHGTGGTFRSFIAENEEGHGRASDVANLPGGGKMAMLSWDQVQHGPRRGGLAVSPESLFFNFLNPAAARDNTLQGAGDVIALIKFLKETTFDVPGFGEITFNADKVMYFGHSQGTVTGPPGLVFTDVEVVLMSGAGGNLVQSLLNKTQPVNIADGIRFALADDGVNPFHEILNILQHFIAPSDTINYGRQFFLEPPEGYSPKHVMHIYGKRDFFAPEANQRALAGAMGVTHLGPELTVIPGIDRDEGTGPLKNNIELGDDKKVTGVVVQYVPSKVDQEQLDGTTRKVDEYDGHFVSFRTKDDAILHWQKYLESALDSGTPEVNR
jgi:hypothetical protein